MFKFIAVSAIVNNQLNPASIMKNLYKSFLFLVAIVAVAQIYACTKAESSTVSKTNGNFKPHRLGGSDSDSTYLAHIAIDSSHVDSARYFTTYLYITTAHSSTRITVPGNFIVTSTLFYGTPIQTTGSDTIHTGHNYGSSSFGTTYKYPLTFTNQHCTPSTYGGVPITIVHDSGPFTP
jgi:hypothetical protein